MADAADPEDIGGVALAAAFSAEVVEPLLAQHLPQLRYAAALIGPGSEILGFDDSTSRDHDWGPRLMLFLEPPDHAEHAAAIVELLRGSLPTQFRGYSTNFEQFEDDRAEGPEIGRTTEGEAGAVQHRVVIHTVEKYLTDYLGANPLAAGGLRPQQWLAIPQHKLRTVSEGGVFRDDVGTLTAARAAVAGYFPRDVWLYMLHASYARLGQLSHFMGRCGQSGDELGSRIIAAQLVRDVMHLCFLLERVYAPYAKWFGTGFARLRCATTMTPHLHAAMDGGGLGASAEEGWKARDAALARVYELLGEALDAAGVLPPQPAGSHVRQFWDRPFRVPNVAGGPEDEWVTTQLAAAVEDEGLRRLCKERPIGAAEQHLDSTDVLERPELLARLAEAAYRL